MARTDPRRGKLVRLGAAAAAAAALAAMAGSADAPAATTALAVQTAGPARYVRADDGRTHLVYDLLLTNSFVGDVTLRSLDVRSGGRMLQHLDAKQFAAHAHPILTEGTDVHRISPSSTVMVLMDVPLPRRAKVPAHLTHRIHYKLPEGLPADAVIGSTTVHGPRVRAAQKRPMRIAPPLRGRGWWAGGGCCNPDQHHRGVLLANNGRYVVPEMFDIDWLQIAGGRIFKGDGTKLRDYPGYGARIHSVAAGKVVDVSDGRPNAPLNGDRNPDVDGPDKYPGNKVVVRIAPNRYAFYAHLKPGSVRVRVGQRVGKGQALGLLGNSGNSTAPHLHFGIHNGPVLATSASLPYVIDRYRYQGSGSLSEDGTVAVKGRPRAERRTYPLNLSSLVFRR